MSDRKRESSLGEKEEQMCCHSNSDDVWGQRSERGGDAVDFQMTACIGSLMDSNTPKTTTSSKFRTTHSITKDPGLSIPNVLELVPRLTVATLVLGVGEREAGKTHLDVL